MSAPLTFSEALGEAEWLAKSAMPDRAGRIDAAITMIKAGTVFQTDTGHWEVDSRSTPGKRYDMNGTCICDDAHFRKDVCAHQMAVLLSRKVLKLMQPQPPTTPQMPPPSPAPPLPEARSSVSVHLTVQGRDCLVTLRDHDEASLMQRLEKLLSQVPAPVSHSFAHPERTSPQSTETPQCPTHGSMKQSTKGKGWFCPNRLDDGSWCTSKGR
jgi:hypothetical protein